MTIAACYLSSEAVVFGADSTATFLLPAPPGQLPLVRHYNFAQKIFEIGEPSTLAVVIWGLGSLPTLSYRTLLAQFADHLRTVSRLADMTAVAAEWSAFFWQAYTTACGPVIQRVQDLAARPTRTPDEEREFRALLGGYAGGFCLGGNLIHARQPAAYEVSYSPLLAGSPVPTPLGVGDLRLWGAPNIMERILFGIDSELLHLIVSSPHWSGTPADLLQLVQSRSLVPRTLLPLRDAIDRVHASIYTTIKAMKFSELPLTCGGPVEVAAITADRHFRWVRHKPLDAAIEYRGLADG